MTEEFTCFLLDVSGYSFWCDVRVFPSLISHYCVYGVLKDGAHPLKRHIIKDSVVYTPGLSTEEACQHVRTMALGIMDMVRIAFIVRDMPIVAPD